MIRLTSVGQNAAKAAGNQLINANNIPPMFRNQGSQESKQLKQLDDMVGDNPFNIQESQHAEENKKLKEEIVSKDAQILKLEKLVASLTETTNKFASYRANQQNQLEKKDDPSSQGSSTSTSEPTSAPNGC